MNPLFIVGVGVGAWFLYQGVKADNAIKASKEPKTKHIPLASSTFTNLKENPFQQKEKILVEGVYPTQQGQLTNKNMAGRWMLKLPGGALAPMHCSWDTLQRKVVIILPAGVPHEKVKGFRHLGGQQYALESTEAMKMFEQ
jgi:hypothetical protein